VAKFDDAIYVDLNLAALRYRDLLKKLGQ
jgi:hypothetical protein